MRPLEEPKLPPSGADIKLRTLFLICQRLKRKKARECARRSLGRG